MALTVVHVLGLSVRISVCLCALPETSADFTSNIYAELFARCPGWKPPFLSVIL